MSRYDTENYDYEIVKGDTQVLEFEVKDSDGVAIDVTNWESEFNVQDPNLESNYSSIRKTHDDSVSGGDGIYYNGDAELPATIAISASNVVKVILTATDTGALEPGVYPYSLEFTKDDGVTVFTLVRAYLIITKEIT